MADMKEEEFKEKALYDLDFERIEKDIKARNEGISAHAAETAERAGARKAEYEQKLTTFNAETSALKDVSFFLDLARKTDPKLAKQAEAYLNAFMNKDLDRETFSKKNQDKEVDIDGSKRGFWGKLKNKAKNFLKPGNTKHMLEESIKKLQEQVAANPETFESLKQMSRPEGKAYDPSEKVSFEQIVGKQQEMSAYYNEQRVGALHDEKDNKKSAQDYEAKAQANQDVLNRINDVKDKAAREVELRSMARETSGIKDMNANTGVDRLGEKAKAMEGMTPEQRLAYRMGQLRGTNKDEAKSTVKRDIDSNVMNKALEGKMRA